MTTTQPPPTPGDIVLVKAVAVPSPFGNEGPALELLSADGQPWAGDVWDPTQLDWHPMPAEDSSDAAHVARLEAELAEYRSAFDRLDAHNAEIGTPGQAVAWVLRDLDEARKERDTARRLYEQTVGLADRLMAKLAALRAGVKAIADHMDGPPGGSTGLTANRLRILLDAAPPTTTPDGTGTAGDGSDRSQS